MLQKCAPGTFLIRFSEGEPGGVSIAWVTEGDLTSSESQVLNLAPWNKHDLSMRSFADRSVCVLTIIRTHDDTCVYMYCTCLLYIVYSHMYKI